VQVFPARLAAPMARHSPMAMACHLEVSSQVATSDQYLLTLILYTMSTHQSKQNDESQDHTLAQAVAEGHESGVVAVRKRNDMSVVVARAHGDVVVGTYVSQVVVSNPDHVIRNAIASPYHEST
jgi:hypothetical protein